MPLRDVKRVKNPIM